MTQLHDVVPRLPANDIKASVDWYVRELGFRCTFCYPDEQTPDYAGLRRDEIELHLSKFDIDPKTNYIMLYLRVEGIAQLYADARARGIVHPNGHLERKPWRQLEFAVLDPNGTLLTFGQEDGPPGPPHLG